MQALIVGLIVATAAWAVARRYLPAVVRRRSAAVLARLARSLGLARLATWLEVKLPAAASCADGCGSCGNCGPAASGSVERVITITPEALKRTHVSSQKYRP